jgi:hypothetical protein
MNLPYRMELSQGEREQLQGLARAYPNQSNES